MEETTKEGVVDQLKNLIRDGVEYLNSLLTLQQAKFTSFFLSTVLFVIQILFACLLGLAAFILFNVALGLALAKILGNGLWAVGILGSVYTVLAILLSYKAFAWLRKLNS